jgi:hypothetical protein
VIQQVISKAVAHLGYKEGLNNDNIFAKAVGHKNNQPWCASFICAVFKEAGIGDLIVNSAACVSFEAWGTAHKLIVPLEKAKRGDLVLFDFTGSKLPQHIGIAIHDYDPVRKMIQTIEGNSGDHNQANGDGVYKKNRQAEFVRAVIRPPYKENNA